MIQDRTKLRCKIGNKVYFCNSDQCNRCKKLRKYLKKIGYFENRSKSLKNAQKREYNPFSHTADFDASWVNLDA
ncbi:MAG: hypothetical protein DRZ76_01975 [Candidatus Nealsonbacteria bacterium]|nr:MAG: hypothetical protein DRZ76_01975 [Candidatus Nealsonbacteria bacterium]